MLAKRVRAWKVGIQCLDQNWDTFDTPAGRRILENSLVKTVMRVDETAAPAIIRNLGLAGHHAEVILSAGVGEGIMLIGSKPYHVYFQASPAEIEMLTPHTRQPVDTIRLPTRKPSPAGGAATQPRHQSRTDPRPSPVDEERRLCSPEYSASPGPTGAAITS
jgi:hypothetical protein